MVLDTSALIAILFHEPEREDFILRVQADRRSLVSTVTLVELELVLSRTGGPSTVAMVAMFLELFSIQTVPFDLEQSVLAREAFHWSAKGTTPRPQLRRLHHLRPRQANRRAPPPQRQRLHPD